MQKFTCFCTCFAQKLSKMKKLLCTCFCIRQKNNVVRDEKLALRDLITHRLLCIIELYGDLHELINVLQREF